MKSLIIVIFLFITSALFCQTNFQEIDKNSKKIPAKLTTAEDIARHLAKDLNTDTEKVRAFYIWITHNIEYDLSFLDGQKRYASKNKVVAEAIKNRKGVCQHYADLFNEMCTAVGIESYTITGYVLDHSGGVFNYDHAWNGVKIDSGYYLVDATWGAGYIDNNKFVYKFDENYFLIEPDQFIRTHMPFDPLWQFLDNPITSKEFQKKDFSKTEIKGDFDYKKIIRELPELDLVAQLEQSIERTINCGVNNKLINVHLDENNVHLTIAKLNKAIEQMNYGIKNFNQYMALKNKKFNNPNIGANEVKELLANAETGINFAHSYLNSMKSNDLELSKTIINSRNLTNKLKNDLEKEKLYTEKYFKNKKRSSRR